MVTLALTHNMFDSLKPVSQRGTVTETHVPRKTTPISVIKADEYWSSYHWAKQEAFDEKMKRTEFVPPQNDGYDYGNHPIDPSHPRAYIPEYVRWAKRRDVNFKCPVTGWAETDFYQGNNSCGPIYMVGVLTMDHIIPAASGGLTTNENLRAMSQLVNTLKGKTNQTDLELQTRVFGSYKLVEPPTDLKTMLIKYWITRHYTGQP